MTVKSLVGKRAPHLSLPRDNGDSYTLEPVLGTSDNPRIPVVLFFYPSPKSFGCTKEACQFRDAIAENDAFQPGRVEVVGISSHSVERQREFVTKNKLTYPVLSDTNREAFAAYHVGRALMGISDARVTFVIDRHGIVRDALDTTINYAAHVKFVKKWLEKLQKEDAETDAKAGPKEATPATVPAAPVPVSMPESSNVPAATTASAEPPTNAPDATQEPSAAPVVTTAQPDPVPLATPEPISTPVAKDPVPEDTPIADVNTAPAPEDTPIANVDTAPAPEGTPIANVDAAPAPESQAPATDAQVEQATAPPPVVPSASAPIA